MNEGTPQGSLLSPVLWLLFIAHTLKKGDVNIKGLSLQPTRRVGVTTRGGTSGLPRPASTSCEVKLFSYADDVNALVITQNTTTKEHMKVVREADRSLEDTAKEDKLAWDLQKNLHVHFFMGPKPSSTTLGITIGSDLSFQKHIDARTKKAEHIWGVLRRLGNSNRGMSPLALRALYNGMIRQIFTCGAELCLHQPGNYSTFRRLDY